MARFYFDVTDKNGFHPDPAGEEFDSFEDARQQCQSILPDIVRDELPDGDLHRVSCVIRDETGRNVYRGEVTYRGEYFR